MKVGRKEKEKERNTCIDIQSVYVSYVLVKAPSRVQCASCFIASRPHSEFDNSCTARAKVF